MRGSIQEMFDKFKAFLEDDTLFFASVIMCIAVASFGLGRYSVTEGSSQQASVAHSGVTLTQSAPEREETTAISTESTATQSTSEQGEKQYVASKNGIRYYFLWCGGVSRINEENKVYFATEAEALAQGYTPAVNCDGLKGS